MRRLKKQRIASFEEAENYINETPRFTTKNTMEDTKAFLHRLGDPDRRMRMIHVAGTNGKGSVCAYLRCILEAAGYRTAVFTSPHLTDIRERFVADGEMISREDFLCVFLQVYDMLDWEAGERGECFYHPTYFEYLFFMAMLFFAEKAPDFCILETGLGGRLDATNAVSKKELAVITRIGLDHVEYLGDTLKEIAGEKAGIMKAGTPAVYWDTCPETTRVFESRAAKLGVSAQAVSKKDYRFLSFTNKSIDFSLHTRYYNNINLTLHTIAGYQMENAALAVRAAELLDDGRAVTAEEVRRGVAECFWAGRMEEVLPEVYVDGAHNGDGIRAFLETVASDGADGGRLLVFGVVQDKDYGRMAEELVSSRLFERIYIAHLETKRGTDPEKLKALFERYPDCSCRVCGGTEDAFRQALDDRERGQRVYIAGSLYLIGEIKEILAKRQDDREIDSRE
ncbi:MAG: bifunctional folylpolyglutamate synthase/dihydrofolate synthase [Roseburia sp.]|nr:bifunctional folylpolyglutamate synthase/dihydrofolate synthase [Roseburia sp.]MCM1097664.1 bifunctional folylpolyglutamate synthase/dihydrofolate synthase [Ruminococcus flavefaciens]